MFSDELVTQLAAELQQAEQTRGNPAQCLTPLTIKTFHFPDSRLFD